MPNVEKERKRILITGVAGFIGFHLARRLLCSDPSVDIVGIDNINNYYDTSLKLARLKELGITIDKAENSGGGVEKQSALFPALAFRKIDISDRKEMEMLFAGERFDIVVHLAAQASARNSTRNPRDYVSSNIDGFFNVLEGCRQSGVGHLIYASSSSVYGLSSKIPFTENDDSSHPVSLYAATKKSNELMAHSYASVYGLPVTGLRFFSVYGPWGRPDMTPFVFVDAMLHNRPVKMYNDGDMYRDFTYVGDVVESIARLMHVVPGKSDGLEVPYSIYNVGNSHPVKLHDYINEIERSIGVEARREYMPMQAGDVYRTYSDSGKLRSVTGYAPSTSLEDGMRETTRWYKDYYNLK